MHITDCQSFGNSPDSIMAVVSVLVVAILLYVSNNAISQCPPDSGKSLNVITN